MAETDATISFPGLLEDAGLQIESAGFKTELWEPTFGWTAEDEEASQDPHPPQLLAAYQIFLHFFVCRDSKKAWVHLGAEMQAGKTGVLAGLIRLILSNHKKLQIHPSSIFTITGMSDTAWKKQTKERLIGEVRKGVAHNGRGGLEHIAAEIHKNYRRTGELRNMLLIVDESHIAAADSNRPNAVVFRTIEGLCPREKWAENNIHILTISATDPAKVIDITTTVLNDSAVVRLQTTVDYQSVETLLTEKRIIPIQGDIDGDWGMKNIKKIITEKYENTPLYHIFRPKVSNYQKTIAALTKEFPGSTIIPWDSSSKGASGGGDTSTASEDDINDILENAPVRTTFIILKNMFYAAKTLEDKHVGILFDRVGAKDDTNLQSLLGRACGYFKSKRTYIFTSMQTVQTYIACWKELCSKKGFPPAAKDIPKSRLNKKMTGVTAFVRGGDTHLATDTTSALSGGAAGGGPAPPPRARAVEENFTSEWREFPSFAAAKTWATRVHKKEMDENGFYLSSTTGSTSVLTYGEVMGMKAGKKTANMPWGTLSVGAHVDRLYVAYKDVKDPSSAVFVVRRLTRNS
jgi:hypothetical protein